MGEVRFAEALGRRLRQRREELGETQDEVARGIRSGAGLDWTRSVIATIENGRRELTLPELAIVLATLETNLTEILGGIDEVLVLTEGPAGSVVGAENLLAGLLGRVKLGDVIGTPEGALRAFAKAYTAQRKADERIWPGSTIPQRIRAERAIGEAETKAGKRLGVTARAVSLGAHRLWGRSLTEERDARVAEAAPADATPRTIQALRGHVTRALLEELRPVLRRGRRS